MNSKEALERLKSMPTCSECENYGKCFEKPLCNELYNIISIDLDRLEHLEKGGQVLMDKAFELSAKLTKYKKSLDILISKKVDVNHLKRTKDFNGYNRIRHFYEADYLMEEEYKLLKEVLDCEKIRQRKIAI